MKIPIYQADAFTDKMFGGNPAAVCPLEHWLTDGILQNIAAENNLSETAFFVRQGDGYHLRWFTPLVEVELCGHATLASAHILFHHLGYAGNEILFHTRSGILKVKKEKELLVMDFPADPCPEAVAPPEMIKAIGIPPLEVYKSIDYLLVYENEDQILAIQPDFSLLGALPVRGLIITAPGKESDFVSRFFAPAVGVNEDPVTGSAHTRLIPYWAKRLNKNRLYAIQLSKRKGHLYCTYLGERVEISGKAVTYSEGEIIL